MDNYILTEYLSSVVSWMTLSYPFLTPQFPCF